MVMKMNKDMLIEKLQKSTLRDEDECLLISDILDTYGIIGRKNKKKIIKDFMEQLKIEYEEANELYNICMESVLNGFLRS